MELENKFQNFDGKTTRFVFAVEKVDAASSNGYIIEILEINGKSDLENRIISFTDLPDSIANAVNAAIGVIVRANESISLEEVEELDLVDESAELEITEEVEDELDLVEDNEELDLVEDNEDFGVCKECGAKINHEDQNFCTECGDDLNEQLDLVDEDEGNCPDCGFDLEGNSYKFCPNCGESL